MSPALQWPKARWPPPWVVFGSSRRGDGGERGFSLAIHADGRPRTRRRRCRKRTKAKRIVAATARRLAPPRRRRRRMPTPAADPFRAGVEAEAGSPIGRPSPYSGSRGSRADGGISSRSAATHSPKISSLSKERSRLSRVLAAPRLPLLPIKLPVLTGLPPPKRSDTDRCARVELSNVPA